MLAAPVRGEGRLLLQHTGGTLPSVHGEQRSQAQPLTHRSGESAGRRGNLLGHMATQ